MNTFDLSSIPYSHHELATEFLAELVNRGGTDPRVEVTDGPLGMTHLVAMADELPPGEHLIQALVDGDVHYRGASSLAALISAKGLWNDPPSGETLRALLDILVFASTLRVAAEPLPTAAASDGWTVRAETIDAMSGEREALIVQVPRTGPLTTEPAETTNVVAMAPGVALIRALDEQEPTAALRALNELDDHIYDGGEWTGALLGAVARAAFSGNHAVRGQAFGLLPDTDAAVEALRAHRSGASAVRLGEARASAAGLAGERILAVLER